MKIPTSGPFKIIGKLFQGEGQAPLVMRNTLSQVVGKGVSTVLGVGITVILTRYLGPTGYGAFTFVTVFVTMFGTLADWGINLITVREASKESALAAEIIGNVIVIRLMLSLVAAGLAVVAINLLPYSPQIRLLVSVAAVYLIALSAKTSFQIIFNVRLKMQYWAISEVAGNLLVFGVLLYLIEQHAGLLQIILLYLVGHVVAAMVAAFFGLRLLPIKYSVISKTTKYLLLESLPMGGILVLFTLYNRLDTIILSWAKGEGAVGLYGAAYRVFEVLVLGAAYFANSVLPMLSRLAKNDKPALAALYRKSFVVLAFLGLGVAVSNFIFAPWAIAIIAGPKFSASVTALRILSLALMASYFNHLNGYTLVALGKQRSSLFIAVIALLVNLGLNLVFIPQYSFLAAALITFITEGLIVLMSLWFLSRELGKLISVEDFVRVIASGRKLLLR